MVGTMERRLGQDVAGIRHEVVRMAGVVEAMIGDAMSALLDRDWDKARGVIIADKGIDLLEKEIDEACHSVLVRHQPTAVDLRFLVAVMKINNDLERMGDSAVNIAEAVEVLNQEPPLKPY